jgi:nucleotide-binding universal stress UspA family protein
MFQQLLLAVDDSPGSQVAISFATALAQPETAAVHVLYVNEYLVGGRGLTLHTQTEANHLVADAVRQLRSAGIEASGSVCISSYRHVADRIAASAQRRGVDAIVLGSSRSRRLGRLFSRQLRERTIRRTSLPVVTAPPPLKVSDRRLELVDAVKPERDREAAVSQ